MRRASDRVQRFLHPLCIRCASIWLAASYTNVQVYVPLLPGVQLCL
ncbi:hypothetical protein BRPE64_ACDS01540 [Caballeronia insecticola]|uniref:Uncharacterized protein n=1 Tax=Caballeronia insecticola TaxID=758793 RepID=R4WEP4_9BURK|nr:hypothetical protein BRPE64_ACDS01540 [Caballeronia insecticola]